jgi:hypothetical protein
MSELSAARINEIASHSIRRSRDSAVGIATGYGLGDRGFGFRVPVGSRMSLLHVVQTGSGVHQTSYPMGTGGVVFPGVKRPGREDNHSSSATAEFKKNVDLYIHFPTRFNGVVLN